MELRRLGWNVLIVSLVGAASSIVLSLSLTESFMADLWGQLGPLSRLSPRHAAEALRALILSLMGLWHLSGRTALTTVGGSLLPALLYAIGSTGLLWTWWIVANMAPGTGELAHVAALLLGSLTAGLLWPAGPRGSRRGGRSWSGGGGRLRDGVRY